MAEKKKAPQPDALELAATWVSAVLLGALLAFLVWDAFQPSLPAAFETSIETPMRRGSRMYVPVAVRNVGNEAARMVQVKVGAEGGSTDAEGHFTIEWLPGRSARRGIAVLPSDAPIGQLKAEVEGYGEP